MDSIQIHGGVPLQGKVRIQGSKNASLPILAGTLLANDICYLSNCPRIADVYRMLNLLRELGCHVYWTECGLVVNSKELSLRSMQGEAITGMRSSLCLLGAMVSRFGQVVMEHPGGCVIGERPIDLHIYALSQMGVEFTQEENLLIARAKSLQGCRIALPKASVGATENILLAAVLAKGNTQIVNAAKEPEVVALCEFLSCCGAQITGAGTSKIEIAGVSRLHGSNYCIPADRIVAGTYLFASVITGGTVFLEEAPVKQMQAAIQVAEQMGSEITIAENGLYIQSKQLPLHIPALETEVYPGFPTDLQSMVLVTSCLANGESRITEKIFENRFRIVEPLRTMGADIVGLDEHSVLVRGVEKLRGNTVCAKELRGGAALVLAGLAAEGKTLVTGGSYIERGYENICRDLRELGARVVSV